MSGNSFAFPHPPHWFSLLRSDGNVRYYEYEHDDLFYLSVQLALAFPPLLTDPSLSTEFTSPQPQRGMCFLPPRALNVNENEIARAFKAVGSMIEPISFVVPRKVCFSSQFRMLWVLTICASLTQSDAFQSDIFPPALSAKAALTAEQWLSGQTAQPILVDLDTGSFSAASPVPAKTYTPSPSTPARVATPTPPTPAPVAAPVTKPVELPTPAPAPAPTPAPIVARVSTPPPPVTAPVATNGTSSKAADAELAKLREENDKLRDEVAERDTIIRELEVKLERVKV